MSTLSPSEIGSEVWKSLEKAMYTMDRSRVFADWLDLILATLLSLTDNVQRGQTDPEKFDGVYEERYLKLVKPYADGEKGNRPIDHLVTAWGLLAAETQERKTDVLGPIYMENITFGEHGQFFTPASIGTMMAEMLGSSDQPGTCSDPACGSGGLLIEHGKRNPSAILFGTDISPQCAKMAAINMILFGFNAHITWGDTLAMKAWTEWTITAHGFIFERDVPQPEEKGQLPLLAA